MWKSNCLLSLITGCAILSSKNCHQALTTTVHQCFTSILRNIFPVFFKELLWNNHTGRFYWVSLAKESEYTSSPDLVLWKPSLNFFLKPFRCSLIWISVCLLWISISLLNLRTLSLRSYSNSQIFSIRFSTRQSHSWYHQLQHVV